MGQRPLELSLIRIDGGTQPRTAISDATVTEYADSYAAGRVLPAIDVFADGADYWLADGFHRYFALKRLAREFATVVVHEGTRRDAVLFSTAANHTHGLQRTNADKRKAVMTLLADEEWRQWSDKEIAKRCDVSYQFVADVRGSLSTVDSEKPTTRTYTSKHGTEATMRVGKIGKTARSSKTRTDRAAKYERARGLAARGHSTPQIAAALDVAEEGLRAGLKRYGIVVPADRIVGKHKKHDANRIVEHMVMGAENLTGDVKLIDFDELDRTRLDGWLATLRTAQKDLAKFIRRLLQEKQTHG